MSCLLSAHFAQLEVGLVPREVEDQEVDFLARAVFLVADHHGLLVDAEVVVRAVRGYLLVQEAVEVTCQ